MRKISFLVSVVLLLALFPSTGMAKSVDEYKLEYHLFNEKEKTKSMDVNLAFNSLDGYAKEVMLKDLKENDKTLEDVVSITKTYTYFKRDGNGDILPLNSNDIQKIKEKINKIQSPYEKGLEKTFETKVKESPIASIFTANSASASPTEFYDGISVTTWATDYSSGSSYDVRYKLYGVFNWLWDDDSSESYSYNPSMNGDDFMTLNWAGDLTLENDRYAEVQVLEYPWDTSNTIYTYTEGNSSGFIELADVVPNGGIGYRFEEMYQMGATVYEAKADNGHMWVYVHKNTAESEDGNFKFTYTHTWKAAEIGYSIEAGLNTAAGSVSITYVDKTKNFVTYDSLNM